jgi:type I restriction enzyme S subunit
MSVAFEEKGITHKIDLINYETIKEPDLKDHIDRVGIELFSKWKELQLSEITEPIKDTYNPDGSNDFTYIGLEHIEQETLRLNSVGVSSDVTSNKFKFQPNDVLFGKLRPYFRKVVKPQFEGICSTDIWVFRSKKGFDQDFLFYFLANKEFVDTANSGESGSRMPRADWNYLKVTNWNVPPLSEQTTIASILSSLDDKIDLLHRQNKTLEQLAETLFRQWFVEEAEDSWEAGTLDDEFDLTMGQSPLGSELNEDKIGTIFYQGRSDFGFRFPTPRVYTTAPTRLAKPLDILVSVRAPVGDMNIAFEECCLGRGVAAFRYKNNSKFYSYTYYKLRSLMEPIKQFEDNGSVFGSIGKDDFKKLENIIPPFKLIEDYQKEAKPIDNKILLNEHQIRTLTQTRDTLLPKLMSGEVRVNLN